ncbi:MAG: Ig-like domain-containing protein [Candidatus Ventricola sp.]
MMNKRAMALLLSAALLVVGAASALAQEATYVFPYEGFRYTQREGETVLTQTNLHEYEELIASLGTTSEAILASYVASGIVMEVIPQDGGQIAVSVTDAGAFADVQRMSEITPEQLEAFRAQFEESGLYESVALTQTEPVCVRLTSSAMYASMPVYSLRYATLHLGRLYVIAQTIVGRAPEEADDARMADVLAGIKLLSAASDPTPAPTPVPTPTPEPTPVPSPGVAEVLASEGAMEVSGVPAYTNDPAITVSGVTDPSAEVRVALEDKVLGKATAKKDGTFSIKVTLPQEGDLVLAVMTDSAETMLAVHYEMPMAKLVITAPEDTTFTGEYVMVRGQTEPEATVYIEGKGTNTNVKANKNGDFSIRVFIESEGSQTFALRAKLKGFAENRTEITLTREYTQREGIANFRKKMQSIPYANLAKDPEKYAGKWFLYRGRVEAFTDFDGRPCALVCVDNVAVGEWKDPIWIVLSGEEGLEAGDVATFYLSGEGLTLPADGQYTKDGSAAEAPVAEAKFVAEISKAK